jgi:hypothetical protein
VENKPDVHQPNEKERHSQAATSMWWAVMRDWNPIFTDNNQRGRAQTMSSLGLTPRPTTTMQSNQHIVVLDAVDLNLRIGVQGWICTAILRITVTGNSSGVEVQVISD